jgi:hypothetical protein
MIEVRRGARMLGAGMAVFLVVGACTSPGPSSAGRSPTATAPSTGPAFPASTVRVTPVTPTPAMTPAPPVRALGQVPSDCLQAAPPDSMTLRRFGGGFSDGVVVRGQAPAWTVGLEDGVLHVPPVSGDDSPFPNAKVMWVVGPNETQPVTVSGREVSTGDALWFDVYPSNVAPDLPSTYTTRLVLDPAVPNRGSAENEAGAWSIWGIGIGALTAGCYDLTVGSSRGSWTVRLAVGA